MKGTLLSFARSKTQIFSIGLICLTGYFLSFVFYYPGIMTPDSDYQLLMARSWQFTDWHPVIMSVVWRPLDSIVAGPFLMLVFILSLYWASFFGFAFFSLSRMSKITWLIVAIPFLPFTINLVGTIWKDVLSAVSYLSAIVLIIWIRRTPIDSESLIFWRLKINRFRGGVSVCILLLLAFAMLLRHNSLLAAVPILALWINSLSAVPDQSHSENAVSRLAKFTRLHILSALIAMGLYFAGSTLVDSITNPRDSQPLSSLLVFDVLGVSDRVDVNLVPGDWTEAEDEKWTEVCYSPKWWDQVWISCSEELEELRADGNWAELTHVWADVVLEHPDEYLAHRASHVAHYFKPHAQYMVTPDPSQMSLEYGFDTEKLSYVRAYVRMFSDSPVIWILFTMGFWIVASLTMTLFLLARFIWAPNREREALGILMSGCLYSLPLVFVSPSIDLRYVYFTILATCLGTAWSMMESNKVALAQTKGESSQKN